MTIDEHLARRLVDAQFPQWAHLPITRVEVDGWDNRTFRLGDDLTVRLPSGDWYALQVEKEQRWLPVLAPRLPLPIPAPVAKGEPGEGYRYRGRSTAGSTARSRASRASATWCRSRPRWPSSSSRCGASTRAAGRGRHNFFRGGPLATYAEETLRSIDALAPRSPATRAAGVGGRDGGGLGGDPVWFHGDVATGNLLLRDGRLGR